MLWGCSELQVDLKNWLELERWDYDDDDDELERWDYDAGGVCPVSAETSLSDTAWGTEPAWQLWQVNYATSSRSYISSKGVRPKRNWTYSVWLLQRPLSCQKLLQTNRNNFDYYIHHSQSKSWLRGNCFGFSSLKGNQKYFKECAPSLKVTP